VTEDVPRRAHAARAVPTVDASAVGARPVCRLRDVVGRHDCEVRDCLDGPSAERSALNTALAVGYDDVPREATHEDVAEVIDCAPSTAAEHLGNAESNVRRQ